MDYFEKIMRFRNIYNTFPLKNGVICTEFTKEKGVAKLTVGKEHLNANNIMHGAVAFMLADTVSGLYVSIDECMHTTASASINFMRACHVGDELTAVATMKKSGRKIDYINVDITDQNGRLIAQVIFTYYNLERPVFAEHPEAALEDKE